MLLLALVAITMAASYPVRALDGCPSVCSCKWKGGKRTVECADRALITVPAGVDPETQVLDLSGNNLQILPNETFVRAGLANLQKVYLRNCRIGQIDETAFRGLTNLVELDLSNNLLTAVPSYVFRDIPYLRDLSVARNPIQKIDAAAFAACPAMVKVDASHCVLQSVAAGAFDGVNRLESVKLNDNRLTELSATLLESLDKRRSVELHNNPWVCDCHLRPMRLWLAGNHEPKNQPALCAGGPERLSGKPLMELDVEDFDCRPEVRAESRYVEVTEGHNVTVRCRVEPGSTAHIAWYLNGRRLQGPGTPATGYPGAASANPRVFVVDGVDDGNGGGRLSEMTITEARRDDAGQYSCLAENRAGNSEANFTVYVTERPSVIMTTFGSAHVNGVAAAMAALIVFILVLIAVTVMRIRRSGYPSDAKPAVAAGPGCKPNGASTTASNGTGYTNGMMVGGGGGNGVGKTNPALDISSVIERNYDPDLEPGLGPVCTPTGSYHVAGLDLIHDHDASRLEMCDSPMSSTAKPPPSYYSGGGRVMATAAGTVPRPSYDDRTPIIGTGSAGDAYSVGTGSDEVFSYNSQQQLHYGGPGHYVPQQQTGGANNDYPADYGLPIITNQQQHHHYQPSANVPSQPHHHLQYHHAVPQHYNQRHHQPDDGPPQPSVKSLRVWQRGVPVLPATPSLQRFANRTSPTTPGTDV